jgi:hypothetical protein
MRLGLARYSASLPTLQIFSADSIASTFRRPPALLSLALLSFTRSTAAGAVSNIGSGKPIRGTVGTPDR